MKNLFSILLVLAVGFSAFSCSSDDGDDIPNYSIVGKWEIIKYTINGQEMDECSNNGIKQFKSDGIYLHDDYQIDANGDCTETIDSPLIGTYSKSPRKLMIKIDGVEYLYELDFVNENRFILTDTYNNVDFVYTYSKIQ